MTEPSVCILHSPCAQFNLSEHNNWSNNTSNHGSSVVEKVSHAISTKNQDDDKNASMFPTKFLDVLNSSKDQFYVLGCIAVRSFCEMVQHQDFLGCHHV